MPRHFPRWDGSTYSAIPTESESYRDGYECGATWDRFAPHNNYVPGGPWICGYNSSYVPRNQEQWKAYCDATRRNNEEWRRGWHDGRHGVAMNPLPMDHVAVLGYN